MERSLDFRAMLLKISRNVTSKELEEIQFLCVDVIPESLREGTTTLCLFHNLEKQNKLGIDNLDFLIYIFETLNRQDLVLELKSFQILRSEFLKELRKRTVSSCETTHHRETQPEMVNNVGMARDSDVAISSDDYHTDSTPIPCEVNASNVRNPGEFDIRCMMMVASAGAWFAGSAYILHKYQDDPDTLVNLITKAVLPCGIAVRCIIGGSVKLILRATELNGLRELFRRYKSGQLRKDLEKVLVTSEMRNLANGEAIDFRVEMNDIGYRNACLDLIVAYHKVIMKVATRRRTTLRRSSSLPDMTSISCFQLPNTVSEPVQLQEVPPYPYTSLSSSTQTCIGELNRYSGQLNSSVSTNEADDPNVLLSTFLQTSDKIEDICAILDREMVLCHDWRSLASEFGYKMAGIRLLERKRSPSKALLNDLALNSQHVKLSELIDKLLYLERDDLVDKIQGREPGSKPKSLVNLPFTVRKKVAFELDRSTLSQFTDVVHNVAKDISTGEIASLEKRSSPTMALLEELEAVYPLLDISHLSNACSEGGVDEAAKILDEYIKTVLGQKHKETNPTKISAKRKESFKKLKQIGGDSGRGSIQSPTEEINRPQFPIERFQ